MSNKQFKDLSNIDKIKLDTGHFSPEVSKISLKRHPTRRILICTELHTRLMEQIAERLYNLYGQPVSLIVMHPATCREMMQGICIRGEIKNFRYRDIPVYRSEDVLEGEFIVK